MLHIIFLILKIIGIVLLCIAGLLLFVIVSVLFVPIRYQIRLVREEGEDKPPVVAYAKVTWFLHLINVTIRYPAETIVRVRILVFTLFRIAEKEKNAERAKKTKKNKRAKKSGRKENQEEYRETEADTSTDMQRLTVSEDNKGAAVPSVTKEHDPFGGSGEDFAPHEEEQEESEENNSLSAKIGNVFRKIKQFVEKIKEFFKNIQYTIRKLCDKIKATSDNIQYYREVMESDHFRQSVTLCKGELVWALNKLKPDKFEADLIVGMEDPATTGEILAICGMLYPLIGQHVRVVGNFECEKTYIEGRVYVCGRVRAVTFIRMAIKIYFNKDIKNLIKLFKKEAV